MKQDFQCRITSGIGRYSRLGFPDHARMPALPSDWPDTLFRGSLNALIVQDGYPAAFRRAAEDIQFLDTGFFKPAFIIPHNFIENNSLCPAPRNPLRGMAQIWRCTIDVAHTKESFNAWAVRRIGSAYADVIEMVSDQRLRDRLVLKDGDAVKVSLWEGDAAQPGLYP